MSKVIRHTVRIRAHPRKVYDALVDPRRHARFTGARATGSKKVGGKFTGYDGHLSGVHVELVPGKRIVQAWRTIHWPKGHHSLATFSLSKARGGATTLTFTHVGVPPKYLKKINQGWRSFYWKPLKAFLEK